ncbi:MAG: NAD+ synthase [Bdellovibrionales bacterium]|nr:NAD+ synthase [Bdellovibrionales bacterium]
MKIGLAQINPVLGDFEFNSKLILEMSLKARDRRCDIVLFPELALMGYAPYDILERADFVTLQLKALQALVRKLPREIVVIFGAVTLNPGTRGRPYHNSAVVVQNGKILRAIPKTSLPNYDVFDEVRHFEPGNFSKNLLKIGKKNILICVCEDIWAGQDQFYRRPAFDPLSTMKNKKVDVVLTMNASPYSHGQFERRLKAVKDVAKKIKSAHVYVNLVGAQDEIIYDGGSFAVDKKGKVLAHSVFFQEDLNVVDLENSEGSLRLDQSEEILRLHQALVLGIQDFVEKNRFSKIHLGLSGGIDSALVACLAVDALGPGRVKAFYLPSEFSSSESESLSEKLAKNLGIQFQKISLQGIYQKAKSDLDAALEINEFGLIHENLQARLRGVILMAESNRSGSLLLNTSNKSELATGYSTLYGDQCGGLSPIGDLVKGQVVALSNYYNRAAEVIPARIISRPPTAELRPNQKDQDSLPEYAELDSIVEKLVVDRKEAKTKTELWALKRLFQSEFKRWQAPPILRVSRHAFGRGRRFPITLRLKV